MKRDADNLDWSGVSGEMEIRVTSSDGADNAEQTLDCILQLLEQETVRELSQVLVALSFRRFAQEYDEQGWAIFNA